MNEHERKKIYVLAWAAAITLIVGAFLLRYMIVRGDFSFSVGGSALANVFNGE